MKVQLTCLTAVYNAIKSGNRDRLVRCVESVARLKTEHEHLIYDGASSDGTVELLRELAAKTPGLVVVSEPDSGLYNALNKGIRDAKGEWLYVLGCDDFVVDPACMDRLISELPENLDVFATTMRMEFPDGRLFRIWKPKKRGIFNAPCAGHQGELIRTEFARRLGGFDERYRIAADADMFLKAHWQGCRFKHDTRTFAVFTTGGVSSNEEASRREHSQSVARVLGLGEAESKMLTECGLLPIARCLGLLTHDDVVIRRSARAMIAKSFIWAVKRFVCRPACRSSFATGNRQGEAEG